LICLRPFYHHDHAITLGENSKNSSSKKCEGCRQPEGTGASGEGRYIKASQGPDEGSRSASETNIRGGQGKSHEEDIPETWKASCQEAGPEAQQIKPLTSSSDPLRPSVCAPFHQHPTVYWTSAGHCQQTITDYFGNSSTPLARMKDTVIATRILISILPFIRS
jgi:hypothetical protein